MLHNAYMKISNKLADDRIQEAKSTIRQIISSAVSFDKNINSIEENASKFNAVMNINNGELVKAANGYFITIDKSKFPFDLIIIANNDENHFKLDKSLDILQQEKIIDSQHDTDSFAEEFFRNYVTKISLRLSNIKLFKELFSNENKLYSYFDNLSNVLTETYQADINTLEEKFSLESLIFSNNCLYVSTKVQVPEVLEAIFEEWGIWDVNQNTSPMVLYAFNYVKGHNACFKVAFTNENQQLIPTHFIDFLERDAKLRYQYEADLKTLANVIAQRQLEIQKEYQKGEAEIKSVLEKTGGNHPSKIPCINLTTWSPLEYYSADYGVHGGYSCPLAQCRFEKEFHAQIKYLAKKELESLIGKSLIKSLGISYLFDKPINDNGKFKYDKIANRMMVGDCATIFIDEEKIFMSSAWEYGAFLHEDEGLVAQYAKNFHNGSDPGSVYRCAKGMVKIPLPNLALFYLMETYLELQNTTGQKANKINLKDSILKKSAEIILQYDLIVPHRYQEILLNEHLFNKEQLAHIIARYQSEYMVQIEMAKKCTDCAIKINKYDSNDEVESFDPSDDKIKENQITNIDTTDSKLKNNTDGTQVTNTLTS